MKILVSLNKFKSTAKKIPDAHFSLFYSYTKIFVSKINVQNFSVKKCYEIFSSTPCVISKIIILQQSVFNCKEQDSNISYLLFYFFIICVINNISLCQNQKVKKKE